MIIHEDAASMAEAVMQHNAANVAQADGAAVVLVCFLALVAIVSVALGFSTC